MQWNGVWLKELIAARFESLFFLLSWKGKWIDTEIHFFSSGSFLSKFKALLILFLLKLHSKEEIWKIAAAGFRHQSCLNPQFEKRMLNGQQEEKIKK